MIFDKQGRPHGTASAFSGVYWGALTDPYGENPPPRLRRATPFCERGLEVGDHTVLPLPFSGYIGGFWPTHMEKIPRHGSAVPPPFAKGGFRVGGHTVLPLPFPGDIGGFGRPIWGKSPVTAPPRHPLLRKGAWGGRSHGTALPFSPGLFSLHNGGKFV